MNATIRPLTENDLPTARRIMSLAFGTFLGAPEPEKFWSDLDYAGTRWLADPTSLSELKLMVSLLVRTLRPDGAAWGFLAR
jgi:hypothetical protein